MTEQEGSAAVVCHTPFKNRMIVFELPTPEGEELLRLLEADATTEVLKVVPLGMKNGLTGERGWQVVQVTDVCTSIGRRSGTRTRRRRRSGRT